MDWKYYNRAMIPDCSPHEKVDIADINNGNIWRQERRALLARWTEEFDCGYETDFWYLIKDDVYDISRLKAKRRYEITKARKNFEARLINPSDYAEKLYQVQVEAFSAYPKKYRPEVKHDEFVAECSRWEGMCFGAFLKDENENVTQTLCGYSRLTKEEGCINFAVQKTNPAYERIAINAALVDGILNYFEKEIDDGIYICDGARSINHETAFQDYLEKYFGFRKAYCKLKIAYNPKLGWAIPILFAFRKVLKKLDYISIVHLINSVLVMEEIKRKC